MDDATSTDEDGYSYSSDQESLNDIDIDESISQPVSCRAKVITKESLLTAQREDLRRVMEKLSLKEHHARTLLIHYRWDVEKLFAVLVEKGKDSLFSGAGLTVLENQLCDSSVSRSSSMMSCDVCIENVPGHQMTQMDCGHSFCNNCWARHFAVKINKGQSKRIICMAHKCNLICDDDVVRTLVSKVQPDLAEKFDRFLLESYVEDNKMVKWCPSTPHCGNAIRVEEDMVCEVECSCGLQFCFSCSSEAHSPCSCVMWELWRKKYADEYQDQDKEKLWRGSSDIPRSLDYHIWYKQHIDSFKLEDELSERIREKVSILEKRKFKLKDFSWATDALYRLFTSRRILAYSYPFAFYMFEVLFKDYEISSEEREMKRNLFDVQQEGLEDKVVGLSHEINKFLDDPFDDFLADGKVKCIRYKIINFSEEADTFCKKMYKCIDDLLALIPQVGTNHNFAPYRSNGIERATASDCGTSGGTSSGLDQASGSGSLEDPTSSSNKRPRID